MVEWSSRCHVQQEGSEMNLYHCTANGLFVAFGDYVYADSVGEARREFFRKHGVTPNRVDLERRAA